MNKITCLWIQDKLDDISIKCIESWLILDYKVDIYTYSNSFINPWYGDQYSENVEIKNANEILPLDINKSLRYEFVADLFRFRMFALNKSDACKERIIWCDTDQFLIRKIRPITNFVSSQYTLKTGAFKHTTLKRIPNIGVMCFDGNELVDWDMIIKKGKSKLSNANQSGYLKYYEKELLKYPELIVEPERYCPVHWAWARDIFTKGNIDSSVQKYGLHQKDYYDIASDDEILGVHLWRQLYKKGKWTIKTGSIYNKL